MHSLIVARSLFICFTGAFSLKTLCNSQLLIASGIVVVANIAARTRFVAVKAFRIGLQIGMIDVIVAFPLMVLNRCRSVVVVDTNV